MLKIPFQFVNMTAFSDHGWRFGKPKAFYITIDDQNSWYKKIARMPISEQLLEILRRTTNTEIIKVIINTL